MTELSRINARIFSRLGQRGAIFGMSILEMAKENPKLMVLTADLASLSGLDRFVNQYPDQFLNMGIAEQNMIGTAAGLASEGFFPVATTYATFISLRSAEQIRHFCGYMKHKIVLVGSGAGFIQAYSGATHYSLEDLSLMRAIPNMVVLSPADAGEAVLCFEEALKLPNPVYIRLTGALNCPIIYKDQYDFQVGKASLLREGSEIAIIATGTITATALKVAASLEEGGISVKVIDMHTIKPIDKSSILNLQSVKVIVTIEEHNIIGGLGGAVSEVMADAGMNVPLLRLGIKDVFNRAGDYEDLLEQNRLSASQILEDILAKYKSVV